MVLASKQSQVDNEALLQLLKDNPTSPASHLAKAALGLFKGRYTENGLRVRLGVIRRGLPEQSEEVTIDESVTAEIERGDKEILTPKTQFQEIGNYATAELSGLKNATTLKELLDDCEVDLKVWEVERWIANKWPVTMKMKEGDKYTAIQIQQYQIKAWLIRTLPIKHEWPIIQPIVIRPRLKPSLPRKPTKGKLKTVLLVPDIQVGFWRDVKSNELTPFHDRLALDVVLQVAEKTRPDKIVFMGDALDLPEWTDKFYKSPEFYFTTQPAVNELHEWLAKFRQHTGSMDYLEGNHELRLPRFVGKNVIAAYNLKPANQPDIPDILGIESLLDLPGLGVNYISPYPDAELWLNDNLRLSHGSMVRQGSGTTVRAMVQKARNSEVIAHTHRLESAGITEHRRRGPVTYMIYSIGTLARIDGGVPASTDRNNWQQGFGYGWYEETGSHLFEINLYPIYGGKTIFNGDLIVAKDA